MHVSVILVACLVSSHQWGLVGLRTLLLQLALEIGNMQLGKVAL